MNELLVALVSVNAQASFTNILNEQIKIDGTQEFAEQRSYEAHSFERFQEAYTNIIREHPSISEGLQAKAERQILPVRPRLGTVYTATYLCILIVSQKDILCDFNRTETEDLRG